MTGYHPFGFTTGFSTRKYLKVDPNNDRKSN